jgi:hypothetical protein
VPGRQQAAARERQNAPGEPTAAQGNGDVHHGQAGADDHHRQVGAERAPSLFRPGVTADPRIVALLRGQVAHCKHHAGHLQPLAAGADQLVAALGRRHIQHVVRQQAKLGVACRLAHGIVENRAEILAIQAARGEQPHLGLVHLAGQPHLGGAPLQPVLEMRRLIGERAHIGGAHIEQMVVITGGIGHAAGEIGRPLAEQHRLVRRQALEKLQGGDGAGKTGADHCDGQFARRRAGLDRLRKQWQRHQSPSGRRRLGTSGIKARDR